MNDPIEIRLAQNPVRGTARIPGSKSITNRALLLAALARGETTIIRGLESDDTRYMADALRAMGVPVETASVGSGSDFRVKGCGGTPRTEQADLFIGNAGTAARFLTALICLANGAYRLDGVARMCERPIGDLVDALRQLGARIDFGRAEGYLPLTFAATGLRGGRASVRGDISSQFLSALLMIGPCMEDGLEAMIHGELVSGPYVEMTLRMMEAFGAPPPERSDGAIRVAGGSGYIGRTYEVEPDASAASYFLAAAAVTGGEVRVDGLGRGSLQGDTRFADLLEAMGCRVRWESDALTVSGSRQLQGIDVDMCDISDTVMTLAAIAPFAESPTRIRNVAHIRHKETDRIAALVTELRRMGIRTHEHSDGLTIEPGEPRPATIETYDDHRMAMSFAVAGLRTAGIRILDPGCTAKTFPGFFAELARLAYPAESSMGSP